MRNPIGKLIISTLGIILAAELLPGVHLASYFHALLLAVLLSVLNTFLKPLLIIFTIPVTILTLGLFLIVINGIMIEVADYLMDSFRVDSFGWAVIFSLILSLITSILEYPESKRSNDE